MKRVGVCAANNFSEHGALLQHYEETRSIVIVCVFDNRKP